MTTELTISQENDNNSALVRYDGGLSSWSPDELKAMVSQEIELRSIVVEYYRSQMIAGKHFYTLQKGQKPALGKDGALNLCSLFKVRVSADEPVETYHDDGHYTVRYRVHLVSMRSGEIVADGEGSCSTKESKYAYRWVKDRDIPGNIDTATLVTRSGQWGRQYRMPNPDLADHYNTVLKMAYKRAIVAAALCLPLVSELFTQDLEEPHLARAAFNDNNNSRPAQKKRAPETPQKRRSGLVMAWDAESQEWVSGPAADDSETDGDPYTRSVNKTIVDAANQVIPDFKKSPVGAPMIDDDEDSPILYDYDGSPEVVQEHPGDGNDDDDIPEPITHNQRLKLLGMLKQVGILDGDKRAFIEYAAVDKEKASAWIDAMVKSGADSMPWDILSRYLGFLRDKCGKTNEDIADFCESTCGIKHPAKVGKKTRDALIAWLSISEEEHHEDTEDTDENADMAAWIEGAHVSAEMLAKMSDESIEKSIAAWKAREARINA